MYELSLKILFRIIMFIANVASVMFQQLLLFFNVFESRK